MQAKRQKSILPTSFLRKGQTNLTKFQVWIISEKIYRFRPICTFITRRSIVIRKKKSVEIVAQNWHPNILISVIRFGRRGRCLPGLCLSSTAIWMSPYGGVVAYRLEWGATSVHVCMYACLSTYPVPSGPNADFVGTAASKRRESAVNRRVSDRWHARHRFSTVMVSGCSICHVLILAVGAERATVYVRTYPTLLSATIKISIFHRCDTNNL